MQRQSAIIRNSHAAASCRCTEDSDNLMWRLPRHRPTRSGRPSRGGGGRMESIYYVMCWACHRKCRHCYEERFRPYVRGELDAVVAEAKRNYPAHPGELPGRHDLSRPRRHRARRRAGAARRAHRPVGRREPARSGAHRDHLSGHRRAERDISRPGRAHRRADHRRPPHPADRRGFARPRRLHDRGRLHRPLPCRHRHAGAAGGLHRRTVGAVRRLRAQALGAVRPASAANGTRRPARSTASSAPPRAVGSARSGRAAAAGATISPPPRWPTISAPAGRAAWASSTTASTDRKSRSSRTARSIPAASRPRCRSATCLRTI